MQEERTVKRGKQGRGIKGKTKEKRDRQQIIKQTKISTTKRRIKRKRTEKETKLEGGNRSNN